MRFVRAGVFWGVVTAVFARSIFDHFGDGIYRAVRIRNRELWRQQRG